MSVDVYTGGGRRGSFSESMRGRGGGGRMEWEVEDELGVCPG